MLDTHRNGFRGSGRGAATGAGAGGSEGASAIVSQIYQFQLISSCTLRRIREIEQISNALQGNQIFWVP